MVHHYFQVHQNGKVKVAAAICRGERQGLIFVRTKAWRGPPRPAAWRSEGVTAGAIHGRSPPVPARSLPRRLRVGSLHAMVATDVAPVASTSTPWTSSCTTTAETKRPICNRSGRTARAWHRRASLSRPVCGPGSSRPKVTRKRLGLKLPIVEASPTTPPSGTRRHVADPARSDPVTPKRPKDEEKAAASGTTAERRRRVTSPTTTIKRALAIVRAPRRRRLRDGPAPSPR